MARTSSGSPRKRPLPFSFSEAEIPGLVIVEPRVFPDGRGYFLESWKRSEFVRNGIEEDFLQDNHSVSSRGVLRGIHFQNGSHAQGKLVRVVKGAVWDVGVDLRKGSASFGRWFGVELTETNHKMLYLPPGFGHGFLTLQDETHFLYKCTREYSPEHDAGIRWDDPDIGIAWPIPPNTDVAVSDKDESLPFLAEVVR